MALYVGDSDNIVLMLGANEVSAAYIGDLQVYPLSPFAVSPSSLHLSNFDLTAQIRIKSPETWTITDNSGGWLSYSASSGSSGVTMVTVTATVPTANRNATITVTTANYSKTVAVEQELLYGFRIENRSANTNTITSGNGWDSSIEYNLNDGSGWHTISGSSITIPANGSANLRGNMDADTVMPQFRATEDWAMIGEVAALHNYSWTSTSGGMYKYWTDISNLKEVDIDLSTITTIGNCREAFSGCGATSIDINLHSLTTIESQYLINLCKYCSSMLYFHLDISSAANVTTNGAINACCANCMALTTAEIDFAPNANFADWSLTSFFNGCMSLTNAPDLRNITSTDSRGGVFYQFYYNCPSLTTVIAPSVSNWTYDSTWGFRDWLYGCAASGIVVIDPSTTNVTTNSTSGIPTGWTRVDSYYSITLDGTDEPFDYSTSDGRSGTVSGSTTTLRLDYPQTLTITTDGTHYHLYVNGVDQGNGPSYTIDYLDLANGDTLSVVYDNEPS